MYVLDQNSILRMEQDVGLENVSKEEKRDPSNRSPELIEDPNSNTNSGKCSSFLEWSSTDWHPVLLPWHAAIILLALALFFVPLGIALLVQSEKLVEFEHRYDDKCVLKSTCTIPLEIPEDMSSPVYVYYKISGFPQNQRRYVISRSDEQLRGNSYEVGDCDPKERNSAGLKYYPCGLVAWTFFNDVLELEVDGSTLSGDNWDGSDVAWDTDASYKFQRRSVESGETSSIERDGDSLTLPSAGDQDLMVWMRTSAFQTFRKLYRVIQDRDLKKGESVNLVVENLFALDDFPDVEKSVVLSTVGWSGGKNIFLGTVYIVMGVSCLVLGLMLGYVFKLGVSRV